MIAITVGAWSVWPLFVKGALKNNTPINVTLAIGACGALILPILYFSTLKTNHFTISWSIFAWALGAYVINMIAQLAFQRASMSVSMPLLVSVTSMYPAITTMICYFALGESITLRKVLGMIAIIIGTIFVVV